MDYNTDLDTSIINWLKSGINQCYKYSYKGRIITVDRDNLTDKQKLKWIL